MCVLMTPRVMLLALAGVMALTSAAGAQVNRRVVAYASLPLGEGIPNQDYLVFSTIGSPAGVTDASTVVQVLFLGEVVASEQISITLMAASGCTPGSVCGQATFNGVPLDRVCAKDPRCIGGACPESCQLVSAVPLPSVTTGISGYQIRVVPAPGSEADSNLTDNLIDVPIEPLIGWDRAIRSVSSSDSNADGVIDALTVRWRFGTKNVPAAGGVTSMDFTSRVEVRRGATPVSSATGAAQLAPNPTDPCTRACPAAICGVTNAGAVATTCAFAAALDSCSCGAEIATVIASPPSPFVPGETVTAMVLAAAGSMPELELLLGNDSLSFAVPSPCPGDANGDFRCDGADLSVLLAAFNQTVASPYAGADFNGDGRVNNADLSVLLGNFGTDCTP